MNGEALETMAKSVQQLDWIWFSTCCTGPYQSELMKTERRQIQSYRNAEDATKWRKMICIFLTNVPFTKNLRNKRHNNICDVITRDIKKMGGSRLEKNDEKLM